MDDSDLRNAFHRLRDAETARAPRFHVPDGAPRRIRFWQPALAAVVLLLIVIVIAVSVQPPRRRAPEVGSIVTSIVTWKAPTDVLLRTPGSELLSTVPRIPDLPERK